MSTCTHQKEAGTCLVLLNARRRRDCPTEKVSSCNQEVCNLCLREWTLPQHRTKQARGLQSAPRESAAQQRIGMLHPWAYLRAQIWQQRLPAPRRLPLRSRTAGSRAARCWRLRGAGRNQGAPRLDIAPEGSAQPQRPGCAPDGQFQQCMLRQAGTWCAAHQHTAEQAVSQRAASHQAHASGSMRARRNGEVVPGWWMCVAVKASGSR